jgi:hypothetical protein
MLDWNPATREPAASLLCFPYFDPSRAESCKYKAATQCTATTAEIEAMVSLAFAAYARRLAVEREVATWMSPHRSLQAESQPHVASRSQERVRSNSPTSPLARRMPSLVTVHEDPLETQAAIKSATQTVPIEEPVEIFQAVVAALPADELPELVPAILSVRYVPPMRIAALMPRALKLRESASKQLDAGWGTLQIGRMNSESAVCSGQQTVERMAPVQAGDSAEKGDKLSARQPPK